MLFSSSQYPSPFHWGNPHPELGGGLGAAVVVGGGGAAVVVGGGGGGDGDPEHDPYSTRIIQFDTNLKKKSYKFADLPYYSESNSKQMWL